MTHTYEVKLPNYDWIHKDSQISTYKAGYKACARDLIPRLNFAYDRVSVDLGDEGGAEALELVIGRLEEIVVDENLS